MTRPGATATLPPPFFHFPSSFNNEFKIPPTTLKMHIVTLFYIFTFPKVKKIQRKSKHEQKEFRNRRERLSNFRNHPAQNNIEIALETNGISFPLWLGMSAEEKKRHYLWAERARGRRGHFPKWCTKENQDVLCIAQVYFFSVPLRIKVEVSRAFTKCNKVGGI